MRWNSSSEVHIRECELCQSMCMSECPYGRGEREKTLDDKLLHSINIFTFVTLFFIFLNWFTLEIVLDFCLD
jgi:hypothetical protein